MSPADGCGMAHAAVNAHAFVVHPGIDPSACDIMRELPYCRTFLPQPDRQLKPLEPL
jgi:hypothetical protein